MTTLAPSPAATLAQYAITVLLVDDQPIVADAVRRMLAPEKDILFHHCQEPAKAISLAAELQPTVILQDLVMPDVDGLTLVRFYRAHPKLKDVPIIVLSSKEEAATKADAFAAGANDYIVKLPDRLELLARIRYHSKGYISLLQRNDAYDALLKSQQALAAELAHAAEYVLSLIPKPLTEGDLRTEWRLVPSAQLGGDSFGYHAIDDDAFAMYLLDVCDHGVGPALLSVTALNVLRSQSLTNVDCRDPGQVLGALNDMFPMEKHNNVYFTLWYGVYSRRDGLLRYASGGHPPALLYPPAGAPVELATRNMMIGGMPNLVYKSGAVPITRPSRLYIFSDGVYEVTRPDGSMWSLAGLKEFLAKPPLAGASDIEQLYAHVQTMRGADTLEDDFSMLRITFA
jgi:sigma-B regulation protein RsbU (phosphoserine phosphatase)